MVVIEGGIYMSDESKKMAGLPRNKVMGLFILRWGVFCLSIENLKFSRRRGVSAKRRICDGIKRTDLRRTERMGKTEGKNSQAQRG